jgi:hypothetical protein
MKKIITSSLVVMLTAILFSCQKQQDFTLPISGAAATQKLSPLPSVRVPFTLSDWFSVNLTLNRDGSLWASYGLKKPLPNTDQAEVKLAYVRRNSPGGSLEGFSYSRLPEIVNTSNGQLAEMTFELSTNLFEIFIRPIGIIPTFLDPDEFKDCEYRYIVISKTDYDNLNIDWNNYKVVASVLNFVP